MTVRTTMPTAGAGPSGPADRPGGFALDVERRGVGGAVRDYWTRLRSGEPGALPSVVGLILLAAIFAAVSPRFLTLNNIGNLPGQGAYIAIIALGLVFVLLLGEIDLSAGTAGGLCAGLAAQALNVHGLRHGIPGAAAVYWIVVVAMVALAALGFWLRSITGPVLVLTGVLITLVGLDAHVVPAIVFAIALGAAIGILNGWLVSVIGIPSFVVTLALFLAWQGVLLFALNSQPIGVTKNDVWYGLANNNMSPLGGWIFTLVITLGYFGYTLMKSIRAQRAGLAADALDLVIVRGAVIVA